MRDRWFRSSLGGRAHAAFADLGRTSAVLAFVILVTALKFTAFGFPLQPVLARWASFGQATAALVAALAISVPLLVMTCNLAPAAGVRRFAWFALGTPLCVLACVASPLPKLVTGRGLSAEQPPQLGALVVLLVLVFEFRQRALAGAGALLQAEIDRVAIDARLRDASLRTLQAQIAPHFLFNTLANVRRLAQIDRQGAAAMLGDLVQYFSVTLSRRDEPCAALADEARLVDAYLRIHGVRMGPRLAYTIEVPDRLGDVAVPSMMLLTLVENALKHGINPLVEGGFIRVRAESRGDVLLVEIADNGRGLVAGEGHGVGLANIRTRLAMLYGRRAELRLEPGNPRGFVATVLIPLARRGTP